MFEITTSIFDGMSTALKHLQKKKEKTKRTLGLILWKILIIILPTSLLTFSFFDYKIPFIIWFFLGILEFSICRFYKDRNLLTVIKNENKFLRQWSFNVITYLESMIFSVELCLVLLLPMVIIPKNHSLIISDLLIHNILIKLIN